MDNIPQQTLEIIPRSNARTRGLTYQGSVCKRGHTGLRYIVGGGCVACMKKGKPPRTDARRKAIENGERLYSTGEPCSNGHMAMRRTTNGSCVECEQLPEAKANNVAKASRYDRAKKQADPSAWRAGKAKQAREWRKRYPDKAKVKDKLVYGRRDKAKFQAYMAEWRAANRARLTEYDNAYKAQWRADNPGAARLKGRLARQRRSAAMREAEGSFTFEDIERLMEDQAGVCAGICGRSIRNRYEIDHKVALIRGGTHWPSNLQLLCRNCNARKHTRTMEEWLSSIR